MSLTLPCIECGGFGRYSIGRPNDPIAPLYTCDSCLGDGRARCEAARCNEVAVDAVVIGRHAMPMCERHMQEWRADADADATD
jgi:hypothetical protein